MARRAISGILLFVFVWVTNLPGALLSNTPHVAEAATPVVIFITTTGASTWTVPSDWNNANNTIEAIGGGGGGDDGSSGGSGGGGGAYAAISNLSLAPGATVYVSVGIGGAASGGDGGDTWLNKVANSAPASTANGVVAAGGNGAFSTSGGAGGTTGNSLGTTEYAGGIGGDVTGTLRIGGGGGGGAGGPHGAGADGGDNTGVSTSGATGGGGADGGAAGNPNSSSTGGAGGTNRLSAGAGTASGGNGSNGGGGGGGNSTTGTTGGHGGSGSAEVVWTQTSNGATAGPGGGGGGGGGAGSNGTGGNGANALAGAYGAGGGGGGGATGAGSPTPGVSAAGTQGIIVITYTPYARATLSKPANKLGLVGYWSFDEGDGTVATDFSGNGKNGTLSGAALPTWTTGKRSGALNFGGTSSYVAVGSVNSAVQTVSFWFKPNVTTSRKVLDMNGTAQIELNASSQVTATSFTLPTVYVDGQSSSAVVDTGWHHVVVTTGTAVNASAVDIGRVAAGYFNGTIDDVRMYSRELSATEAAALYHAGSIKFTTSSIELQKGSTLANGLLAHWTFDGADVTDRVYDRSGQGNNGYFRSGATSSAKTIGKLGQGLSFNGSTYVNTASFGDNPQTLSVSAWFKTTQSPSGWGSVVVGKINDLTNDSGWTIDLTGPAWAVGAGHINGVIQGGGSWASWSSNAAVNDGQWHHVVLTISGHTTLTLYLDGSSASMTAGNSGTVASYSTASNVCVGASCSGIDNFVGTIDDVHVYDRTLSAAEVQQLYKLGRATVR